MSDRSLRGGKLPDPAPPSGASLRPLLPAPPQTHGPEVSQRHFDFKRKRQAAACEPCREHKTKCDGNRPSCSACLRRGSDCRFEAEPKETHVQALKRKFDSLQGEASSLQQVYELLRTRPEDEALSILRKIRDGASHESILQFVHHGDLLMQLSFTASSTSPETSRLSGATGVVASSSRSQPPTSPQTDATARGSVSSATPTRDDDSPQPSTPPASASRRASTAPPLGRYPACEVVEPLLDEVYPSQWTTMMDDDDVMRGLLSQFFQLRFRWGSILHKDYFLQDMASGSRAHCSPLLVNSVLACALNTSCIAENQSQLRREARYRFIAEARTQWESEQASGADLLTTVQAGLLLSEIHGIDSLDAAGWRYAARSIEMANDLGLFDSDVEMADDPRVEHGRTYTAWSVFCWQSIWSHHFFIPPLVKQPPPRPLPDPDAAPDWYGEIYVRYTSAEQQVAPAGHGHLFKAKADFSTTLNRISGNLYRMTGQLPLG